MTWFPSLHATAAIRALVTAKAPGQNGFRLTLRGYAPELDFQWLTREFDARRVCTDVPEESLLLRKPSGLVSHEGGKVFSVGSRPYQILLNWIRAGMPGPIKDEPVLKKLEAVPGQRTSNPAMKSSWPSAPNSATAAAAM